MNMVRKGAGREVGGETGENIDGTGSGKRGEKDGEKEWRERVW